MLIGETFAVVATKQIPPPLMDHVVIGLFAVALAYGTAFTVFLEEILHGLIATIRLIEGEAAAGARAAAIIAEREAGGVGTGLMRLFRARPRPALAPHTSPHAFVAPEPEVTPAAGTPELGLTQTDADMEAADHFLTTAPRSRVSARPVRADQLPRIGWTFDQMGAGTPAAASAPPAEARPAIADPATATQSREPVLPPLPVRTPAKQQEMLTPAALAEPA